MRERIFSAMQPSGGLPLGKYFGARANWVSLARDNEAIFGIVDQHSLTVEHDPATLSAKVFDLAVTYIAAGVDPNRSIICVQSDVPEHTELAWYLAAVTQHGELGRMTQFKEKSEDHSANINAALFTYPVLMAADILLYKATAVPVGEDQVQHLELARDIAHRFNTRFGETFPIAQGATVERAADHGHRRAAEDVEDLGQSHRHARRRRIDLGPSCVRHSLIRSANAGAIRGARRCATSSGFTEP